MTVHYLHTKLRVRDLDAAIRFYETALGYAVRSRRPGPNDSEIAFLTLPDQSAELQLAHYAAGEPFEVPAHMTHLAFKVDDLAAIHARALAAGATPASGPYTLPSGSIVAFIQDPNGYDMELVQKPR
ncbi:MAG: VOC family protein [Candidatus Sericytochromatia bacterium]